MVDRRLSLQTELVSALQSVVWLGRNFNTIDDLIAYTMPDNLTGTEFTYVLSDKNHSDQCAMYLVVEDPTTHNMAFRYSRARVYFQPPETERIEYPCIIYSLSDISTVHADNRMYQGNNVYQLILVDENPDSRFVALLLTAFEGIKFDRFYTADSLNHWSFILSH